MEKSQDNHSHGKDREALQEFLLTNFRLSQLNGSYILQHCAETNPELYNRFDLVPESISINRLTFSGDTPFLPFPVQINLDGSTLSIACPCGSEGNKLCRHQALALFNLHRRKDLQLFFDEPIRHEKIRKTAASYGLENAGNPDDLFTLVYHEQEVEIKPKITGLYQSSEANGGFTIEKKRPPFTEDKLTVLVISRHRYYGHLCLDLCTAEQGKNGALKNPVEAVNPYEYIWKTNDSEMLKYYMAVSRFRNNYEAEISPADLEGLKTVVANPPGLDVFYHNREISQTLNSKALEPVKLQKLDSKLEITVSYTEGFYEVAASLKVDDKVIDLKNLVIVFQYFIQVNNSLYLLDNPAILKIIQYFRQQQANTVIVHESKFEEFRTSVLENMENLVKIKYAYLRQATKKQLRESGFDEEPDKIIYLSDLDNFVEITPVIRYANVEVPVLSQKQVQGKDLLGHVFTINRNLETELAFISMLLRQHPDFAEQQDNHCFFLHKKVFLDQEWFLDTMEEWQASGITVLGFNTLKNNRFNPNKPKISVQVLSGVNWFNTSVKVQFGNEKVSLKQLHRSIRNKSRFVKLGDGSEGILPEEWFKKFSDYFAAGSIDGEEIRTPKISFSGISEWYEEKLLSEPVKKELAFYREKTENFQSIAAVPVPGTLKATLRSYQQEGLNWLNFLDDFNFGACLADDMGLGKTIQVLAFILSQREKVENNINLVVAPTTLLYNWKEEITRFAPSIRFLLLHGPGRKADTSSFNNYEIILTSYGTLQSDIHLLKSYSFNYVILDESQAIKNPESQRYKSVQLLQSRNRIVMTGTPFENNTFDLYGQLSFACPGMLGSKQHFKQLYSTPIDLFKNAKRAAELQKKISPFILRRTKEQVAQELPDKTEMVIYCEMGEDQRRVYNRCEEEFRHFLAKSSEDDVKKSSMYVLQGLTKLRQICNSPALVKDSLFQEENSAKIDTLLEEIENHSPQHKILVFSQFVSMLDLIKKRLDDKNISYEYLTGKSRNRSQKVDNFQNNPDVRVFLISLKVGGTGLNLTSADYVYLVDPWWNPAVENQAIDRSYRIGQDKNVIAVRLICPDTVESKMMGLQKNKQDLANNLVKSGSGTVAGFSKKDLLELLS